MSGSSTRSGWPLLAGRTRPVKLKEWGDLDIMDPDAGRPPRRRGFVAAEKDWLHIDAGTTLEKPVATLYAGDDPGAESGWEEVAETTVISTTGFLALCDSGYTPVLRANLATAGAGTYLIRVHASHRSTDGMVPRFLIQVVPGERAGAEPEPPAATLEEAVGPLLVRTFFGRPGEWDRLLGTLEGGPELYGDLTVVDNHAYTGFTADQVQARIGRDDDNWPHSPLVLIADEEALASAKFPLLAVNNLPGQDDSPFRITLAATDSFIVNMALANTGFHDWSCGVDADGVYREKHD